MNLTFIEGKKLHAFSCLALRLALAASFLSAVADRFGLWGPPGFSGVAWGDFANFLEYTAILNPWAPKVGVTALGWSATSLEVILGLFLIAGFQVRYTALASAALLLTFASAMAVFGGLKGPLDYSVFTASAAALLLALQDDVSPITEESSGSH